MPTAIATVRIAANRSRPRCYSTCQTACFRKKWEPDSLWCLSGSSSFPVTLPYFQQKNRGIHKSSPVWCYQLCDDMIYHEHIDEEDRIVQGKTWATFQNIWWCRCVSASSSTGDHANIFFSILDSAACERQHTFHGTLKKGTTKKLRGMGSEMKTAASITCIVKNQENTV